MKKILTAGVITAFSVGLAFAEQREETGQPSLQQEQQPQEQLPQEQQPREQQPQEQLPQEQLPQEQQPQEQLPREQQAQQQEQPEQQEFGARMQEKEKGHQKLSELKQATLTGPDGEEIGQFEDVVIDLETGAVSFIIVAGDDDARRPVPIASIEVSEGEGELELALNVDRQEFEQAPSLSPQEVAELGQEQRAREIFEHYGEDFEAHQQQQMEFAAPPERDREKQEKKEKAEDREARGPGEQQQEFGAPQQREEMKARPRQEKQEYGSPAERERKKQEKTEKAEDREARGPGEQQQEFGAAQQREELEIRPGQEQDQQPIELGQLQQPQESVKLGRDLTDATVVDQNQQEIGKISDLIIDLEQGQASFALIESQDGQEQYAVSPRALQEDQQDRFSLNISRQEVEQAETISDQDLQMRAQEQQQMETAQIRQSPQIFRYEEGEDEAAVIFGAPDRPETEDPAAERQIPEAEQQPEQQEDSQALPQGQSPRE